MGKKPEAIVRDHFIDRAKEEGWAHERNHKGRGAAVGWPDDKFYPGTTEGRSIIVEFKATPRGKLTPKQAERVATLRDLGYLIAVVTSKEAGDALIDIIDRWGAPPKSEVPIAVRLERTVNRTLIAVGHPDLQSEHVSQAETPKPL